MERYLPILKNTTMFMGIDENEIRSMYQCLDVRVKSFEKNEYILRSGEQIRSVGMVLSGQALVEKDDVWGNRTIIQEITPGMLFAESYACLSKLPVETSVLANEKSEIMFFDISHILTVCSSACSFHTKLIQNLITILARKNVNLTKKLDYLSKKTIRERLLAYLSTESMKSGSTTFTVPFNRQELADYLSIDRSALSNEISKLQAEGLLQCTKNKFTITKNFEG